MKDNKFLLDVSQLLAVASKPNKLVEDDGKLSLDDAVEQFKKFIDKHDGDIEYASKDLRCMYFKDKCPPIRFAGEGVGRMAFVCDGGRCLKVAMNDSGVEQNQNDVKFFSSGKSCFTQLFCKDKDFLMIEVEACAKLNANVLKKILNKQFGFALKYVDCYEMCEWMSNVLHCVADEYTQDDLDRLDYQWSMDNGASLKFIEELEKDDTVQKHVLNELVETIRNEYGEGRFALNDLHSGNWGLVVRDGQLVMVVLDAGM